MLKLRFPYLVGIRTGQGGLLCSGTLIRKHFVLTTASCIQSIGHRARLVINPCTMTGNSTETSEGQVVHVLGNNAKCSTGRSAADLVKVELEICHAQSELLAKNSPGLGPHHIRSQCKSALCGSLCPLVLCFMMCLAGLYTCQIAGNFNQPVCYTFMFHPLVNIKL